MKTRSIHDEILHHISMSKIARTTEWCPSVHIHHVNIVSSGLDDLVSRVDITSLATLMQLCEYFVYDNKLNEMC